MKIVWLADNIEEIEVEGEAAYQYDVSVFRTKDDISEEAILADWSTYWAKGNEPWDDDDDPDVEPMTRKELTDKVTEHDAALGDVYAALTELADIIAG